MSLVSQNSLDAILRGADIVSVVQGYGIELQNRGSAWFGCCPFHSEKTPSFSVTPDKNLYYCFGCHAGGNIFSFVRQMENCSFTEAVDILSKKFSIPIQYEDGAVEIDKTQTLKKEYIDLYTRIAGTFHFLLVKTDAGKFALDYIHSRGFSDETISRFNLGYAPADRKWLRNFLEKKHFGADFLNDSGLFSKKNVSVSVFADRLMFPICDKNGSTVAFGGRFLDRGIAMDENKPPKYMNSGDLLQYQKGETLFAFNFAKTAIRREKRVIFCEGYFDCIAYHQCGIDFAVAPLGTALTEAQLHLVSSNVQTAILSFDSDEAGKKATKKAIFLCRSKGIGVKVVQIKGGKDPAEIMLAFGAQYLREAVDSATDDFEWLFGTLCAENPNQNPESALKIETGLFEYVDSLGTEIEKARAKTKIALKLQISEDALESDFTNRRNLETRIESFSVLRGIQNNESAEIKIDAEMRAIFSVIANLDFFPMMKNELSQKDFENPLARFLFGILLECDSNQNLSIGVLQLKIGNDELWRMITESMVRGEFAENAEKSVKDSVSLLKKRALEKRRNYLQTKIQEGEAQNYDGEDLLVLIEEKMEIDKILDKK